MAEIREETKIGIGKLVIALSLDATQELYPILSAPGKSETVKFLCRTILQEAKFPIIKKDIYPFVMEMMNSTNNEIERNVLKWISNAFSGGHTSNPALSIYLTLLLQLRNGLSDNRFSFEPHELAEVRKFVELCTDQIDRSGFSDQLDTIRENPQLSEWDRRMHTHYGFAYFDTSAGADPFLILKFVKQGEGLRRAIKLYDFKQHPDFPHAKLVAIGQRFVDEHGIWMPDDRAFPSLLEVQ